MSQFVSIDVETANADLGSICQIGVVSFRNGEVVDVWKSLINPEDEFSDIHVSIHGIEERAVAGAPTFKQAKDELHAKLRDYVLISHSPFDRFALSRAHQRYGLSMPTNTWLDTAKVTRRTWPQFAERGYGLRDIATWCGIEFRHHDAVEDARAAGLVLLRAIAQSGLEIDDWVIRSKRPIDGTSGSETRIGNPDGSLVGEVVVFTGSLSIPRRQAADLAAAAGCGVASAVGPAVTLLVVGDQDIRKLGGNEKSSKHRKAEELIQKGQSLRILCERDFRALVGASE